ncbi:MAG TPA: hypothetical protein PK706_27990 [Xanthobacteraceae bacterium]|nr:hypothetical protein [Xanthobacteraceae bacterium]
MGIKAQGAARGGEFKPTRLAINGGGFIRVAHELGHGTEYAEAPAACRVARVPLRKVKRVNRHGQGSLCRSGMD